MATKLITEKYANNLYGVLNCYDRVIFTGSLQPFCYPKGMTGYLYANEIRIFDYPDFASSLRDSIRKNAEAIAKENQVEIEFIRKVKKLRKEKRIKKILQIRGEHPGLVHIFSAMEKCNAYEPWYDKQIGKTYLRNKSGKCLHYYFYFIDEELGLCYLRVPTWCPFRLQFYFNGHNWLAAQLKQHNIQYEQLDNGFLSISDFDMANQLAAELNPKQIHVKLDGFAKKYCPFLSMLDLVYNWSFMQAEYATDLIFKRLQTLQAFYPLLLETLIQAVKPADIATFLGRKLNGNYQGEMGNRFNIRRLGRRIKHQMGPVTIKMYDKFQIILRIEVTVSNVSFFKQYSKVQHRDGNTSTQWAPMKKAIYSLPALQEVLLAANHRYLKFISDIETPYVGVKKLHQLTETKVKNQHRFKGFNLLAKEDTSLFRHLMRGEFFISGFSNKCLRQLMPNKNSGQITRLLKRLQVHKLIKKVGRRYKYYLTEFGRQATLMALKLREMVIIPQLALGVNN